MGGVVVCFALFLAAMAVCLVMGWSFLWALLLGLAGCEDADIVADYALTDIYLRPKVKLFLQHNPNADPALFRAPMESMDRFTAFVREEFGSARGYLKSLGFSDEDLDQVWNPRR